MTVKEFAVKHKVRIKHAEEGEVIVMAKHGQIYDYGAGRFGVMFMLEGSRAWNGRRQECERVGMRLVQDGDTEGTLLFDPEDKNQAKTVIRLVGARQKRQLSPEHRKAAVERLERFRQSVSGPTPGGLSAA